jgi:hypothetical protein
MLNRDTFSCFSCGFKFDPLRKMSVNKKMFFYSPFCSADVKLSAEKMSHIRRQTVCTIQPTYNSRYPQLAGGRAGGRAGGPAARPVIQARAVASVSITAYYVHAVQCSTMQASKQQLLPMLSVRREKCTWQQFSQHHCMRPTTYDKGRHFAVQIRVDK